MKRSKKRPNSKLKVAEDNVHLGDETIGDLKAHIWQKIRELGDRGRPYAVTLNDKGLADKFSPEDYERMTYEFRVLTGIYEGLEDIEAGRVYTDEEVSRILEEDEAARNSRPKSSAPKSSLSRSKK